MFVLLQGSIWNSDCLVGTVINTSPRYKVQSQKTEYPFSFLFQSSKQVKLIFITLNNDTLMS